MVEKKVTYKYEHNGKLLDNEELIGDFLCLVFKKYEQSPEIFAKTSPKLFPAHFELNASHGRNLSERIYEVNDVEFVSTALYAIKQHRIIDDELYKKIDKLNIRDGEAHVIVLDNKPIFRVDIEKSGWGYKKMTIKQFSKEGFFRYAPEFDKNPNEIGLELLVKNPNEDKILAKLYGIAVKYHTQQKFEIIQPKSDNKDIK